MLESFSYLFPTLMIVAAASDAASYRIPNWLTALTAALFFPVALMSGLDLAQIGQHLAAGAILLVLGFIIFQFGFFGGGDAKMIAAAGLWFGLGDSLFFIQSSVLCGGVLAAAMIFWSLFKFVVQLDFAGAVPGVSKVMPKLPYGIALAAGAIIAMPSSQWMMPPLT
jgi:prepilin peptidase CpaA